MLHVAIVVSFADRCGCKGLSGIQGLRTVAFSRGQRWTWNFLAGNKGSLRQRLANQYEATKIKGMQLQQQPYACSQSRNNDCIFQGNTRSRSFYAEQKRLKRSMTQVGDRAK